MGDRAPHLHGCCSQFAMAGGWNVVAGNLEKVGDLVGDGGETLKPSG